jgi:hypothetical protein
MLEGAGLVRPTRDGREKTLHLTAEPLRDAARWISRYQRSWNERLNRLEVVCSFFSNALITSSVI